MKSFIKIFFGFCLTLILVIASGTVRSSQASSPATTASLIDQAGERYESGQYAAAKELWQQVIQNAKEDVDRALGQGNLALTLQQLGDWDGADRAIKMGLSLAQRSTNVQAQLLDIQGQLNYGKGQFQAALDNWQQAEAIYIQGNDLEGRGLNQLNQAQAMQMLGLFTQAEKRLAALQSTFDQQPNQLLKVRGLRSLIAISAKLGRFDKLAEAQEIAQRGEAAIAQLPESQQRQEKAALQLTLAHVGRSFAERERELAAPVASPDRQGCNTYAGDDSNAVEARKNAEQALVQYQGVAGLSESLALQGQLSQLSLRQELGLGSGELVAAIEARLRQQPVSRPSIFAEIHLAQRLLCEAKVPDDTVAKHLSHAITQAQQLQDRRAESYGTGLLGQLYEQQAQRLGDRVLAQRQLSYGKQLSQKALLLADSMNALDLSYQWQWQLGRIFRDMGGAENQRLAIEVYYPQAVKDLEAVRGELVGTNPDVQFSFRDDAEPVYREFVNLLLSEANPSPARLNQAIALIDSLQVAELENFFRCVLSQLVEINQVTKKDDPTAATFYPIILPDRLEVILQLPNQAAPIRYAVKIPGAEGAIDRTTRQFKEALLNYESNPGEYKRPGKQIYEWLLKEAEPYLSQAQVKTLVFVLDGGLRDIPISALWTGQEFVIQKYAVAVTPGLKLLGPKRFEAQAFRALIGGLTEDRNSRPVNSRAEFGPLPFVKEEVKRLQAVIPGSKVLVEREFLPEKLSQVLKDDAFPILHLATHGTFSNNPKETYLVMAQDQAIDLDAFQNLLRTGKGNRRDSLELLVLSACETARGNRRATLGMAGVAIRSGAGSTVATLWAVDDRSTGKLVEAFYTNLRGVIEKQGGGTKVQALREAQLALLENRLSWNGGPQPKEVDFSHPYYWAPFILLGNWL